MWIVNQGIIEGKTFVYFDNEEEAREFGKLTNSRVYPMYKIDKSEWPELVKYITVYADPRYFTEIQKDKNSFNISTYSNEVYSTSLHTIKQGFTINSAMNIHGNAFQNFFNVTEEEAKKEFISILNDRCKVVHIQEAMRPNFERIVEKNAAPPEGYSSKIVNGIEHWYTPEGEYRIPDDRTEPVPKMQAKMSSFTDAITSGYIRTNTNYAFHTLLNTTTSRQATYFPYTAADVEVAQTARTTRNETT